MEAAAPVLAQGAGRVRNSIRRAVPVAGIVNQQDPRAGNATAGRRGLRETIEGDLLSGNWGRFRKGKIESTDFD